MTEKTVEECYREWKHVDYSDNNIYNKETLRKHCLAWFTNYFSKYNDYTLFIKEYIAIQKKCYEL